MSDNSILKNWIVRNLIWAAVFVIGLVAVVSFLLGLITLHGKEKTVPDLSNLTYSEARYAAGKEELKVRIVDSVYVRRMKQGVVFSQNPKPGSAVKKGRTIDLTTNTLTPKKVTMPSLVGFSMRQAKAELASKGLVLGKLIYVNDMATNNVLRQLYRNREVRPGASVESGSSIDLVVGLSSTENCTYVPDVRGMRYRRAVDVLQDNSLNVGRLNFDSSVKNYSDSLNAVVFKQTPSTTGIALTMGSEVSLSLTVNEQKMKK